MLSDQRVKNQASTECPICHFGRNRLIFNASSWESFARDKCYEVRRCDSCNTIFTDSPLEVLATFYSEGLYRETRNRAYILIEALSRMFQWSRLRKAARGSRPGRLLDVGCGKGRFLVYAARKGWNVYGVEPSEIGRRIAQGKLGDRVVSSLDEIVPDSNFDLVTLWHVLEHVPRPIEMLRSLRPFIKSGGWLCVAVPNIDSLQARLGGRHWSHLDVPRHRVHFSPDTLSRALTASGYAVISVDHYSIEFNPLGVLQTALNLLGCEPGLIYHFVKRNLTRRRMGSTPRLLYTIFMSMAAIPLLIIPSFLFASLESYLGKGGTILVHAVPLQSGI